MRRLIFATNNQNKVEEIKHLIGELFEVVSLKEAGIDIEIPEPHATLEENATEKSRTIHTLTSEDCFSEDTGLEVDALDGEPGVLSARYAGEGRNFSENIEKLLINLQGKPVRSAQFKTVISLVLNGKEYQFTGICRGTIGEHNRGHNGFGYDPIFVPEGAEKTFAEMTLQEKSQYSHRKKATAQLLAFLSLHGKTTSL